MRIVNPPIKTIYDDETKARNLTKREYFASSILSGALEVKLRTNLTNEEIIQQAVEMADVLIRELEVSE